MRPTRGGAFPIAPLGLQSSARGRKRSICKPNVEFMLQQQLVALIIAVAIPLSAAGQLTEDPEQATGIRHLTIGGVGGQSWTDLSFLNVLMDDSAVAGALQPLELHPDENFLPALFARYPFERRVDAAHPLWMDGMPRLWRAFGVVSTREPVFKSGLYLVDGDYTTFEAKTHYLRGWATSELYTIDLGGRLPLERFVLQLPPPEMTDKFGEPWVNYVPINGELSASERGEQLLNEFAIASEVTGEFGEFTTSELYDPLDRGLGSVAENRAAPIDLPFPLQYLRYVRWMTHPDDPGSGNSPAMLKLAYAEFELFGDGFALDSTFETAAVPLGGASIIGKVDLAFTYWQRRAGRWREGGGGEGGRRWELGELVQIDPAAAEVEVAARLKAGDTPDPRRFFGYGDTGELLEVDRATWEQLRVREIREQPKYLGWRGPVTVDRARWTPWSGKIARSGIRPALADGTHLQCRVEMVSTDHRQMARLDSVRIELYPVLVPTLTGEVARAGEPASTTVATAPVGEPAELLYAIRASFAGGAGAGFDGVRIQTPSRPEFLRLRRGDPPVDWDPEQVVIDATGLTLLLAAAVAADEVLHIELRSSLYTVAEQLSGQVFSRVDDQVRQRIEPGDATGAIGSDGLLLVAEGKIAQAISDLQIRPRTITPNGDGDNERMQVSFTLLGLFEGDVDVVFYDLSGAQLRRMALHGRAAGVNPPVSWDGRDQAGRLLPPGLYVCQVKTSTSRGRDAISQSVAIVY